tara:strand:+ start:508 stop:897 length:390 start_codon:yes stop_codon:yes gene_type:complete
MATVSEAIQVLDPDGQWVLYGEPINEEEFNSMYRRVIKTDRNGNAVLSNNTDNWAVSWDSVSKAKAQLDAAEPLKLLREERNRRISETDWWASSDLTMSAERTAYRQALRDITNTYSSLDDVVWPDKPE